MLDKIQSLSAYQELLAALRANAHLPGLGLMRSVRLPLAAALHHDLQQPVLYITGRPDQAITLLDELGFWASDIPYALFPDPNPMFYEQAAWGSQTRRDRLACLTNLAAYHIPGAKPSSQPPIIIAPVRALMTRTIPRRDFIKASKLFRLGQSIAPDALIRHLVDNGYQNAETVLEMGSFSRRGGILDFWPPAEPAPVRLEFFGDEIDTMRRFDPSTQRTVQTLEQVLVTPGSEVLPGKAREAGVEGGLSEFDLPRIFAQPASLLDYLPQKSYVLVDDLDLLESTAGEIEGQAVRLRQESITEQTLAEDFPLPYVTWSELQDALVMHPWLELGHSTAVEGSAGLAEHFSPGSRFGGRLKQFVEEMEDYLGGGDQITIVSRQVPRLREMWTEQQHSFEVNTPGLDFLEGTLSEGYILRTDAGFLFHLLTDSEIFGWERPQPRGRVQKVSPSPEDSYSDLKPGDWVVHMDYGIGRFAGLVRRSLENAEREFLMVEYEGGDELFVPVHQADRLTRYIGPDDGPPTPTRLGTTEWQAAKERVQEATRQVAHELLELYARRQVAKGFAFQADTTWQQELEASFPYVETPDQSMAISEVKKDMQSQRPMDRLLCGDVGYGKTEVALRAAFKAVNDSKQVAVLVPTTVLAQQHYETFSQRLAAFPVSVEMLSRFRTPREQDEIIRRLVWGEVDIVIGTHRLLTSDVVFKDLGLVIIDEEQRFGVTHKEHFKKLRTEVDVLTLTATPIPRTLYMALTGVRDISVINTPPAERMPIITHIGPYSPRLVRQAILRELERGGQTFFLHNRVQSIHAMKMHLDKLVPEARLDIAHGQMPEGELASVMHRFTKGEVDVLLCTSIIESGLDIPNANTLIVDRGDTFGLAQLYQLRGRVGRGGQRAYAYFFRHRRRPPTPEGQERLEVIAENTQLGAGYSIAMRDLEMRGAGELLGNRQHGYIAAVGFQLYTRLLSQSVRDLRKAASLPVEDERSPMFKDLRPLANVELPLDIGIPLDYVPDQTARLRFYRRIADLQSEEEIDSLLEELPDRFGPLPQELVNLLYQLRVKLRAEACGVVSITIEMDQLVLRFPALPENTPSRNLPSIAPLARTGKNAYWMPVNGMDDEQWKQGLLDTLQTIHDLRIIDL
jgi:transcription-repair coupling factor (superfamily II helicase)